MPPSVASPPPPRWQRARDLFDAVADLDPAARQARLADLCAGDDELRQDVESLLAHDQSADDPIGRVVGAAARGATAEVATGPGQFLLHYRITGPIAEGGMGMVWRALDETLGRDVAIKVLPQGVGDDPRRLARFEREAKLLASLNHSNIAAIFSLHEHDGVHFLAMEYVPGEDLSVRLLRGPVPLEEALRIARQIAEALEEAHEQGVVHRDLKPANVKLTPSGRVKVLDFGLAKAFTDSPEADAGTSTSSDSALAQLTTREGVVLGTAAYMPPEQARGLVVDKRADIWAFGAVLYEMLTGTRPFAGASVVDLLAAVVTAEPNWTRLPTGTPPALEQLLRRCLQKDVRQRLRDIGDARIEIERLAGESHTAAAPPAAATAVSRRRLVWAGVAAAVVVATVGSAFWLGRQGTPASRRDAVRTIAVLPLVDLSAGAPDDYFAAGLSEELLNRLARSPGLRVAGKTSSFRFRDASQQDARAVGRALGVSAVVEGSVRRAGNRVRITAQLVNADDGFQLWSGVYDREMGDLLIVQDEISRAVAEALQVALLGETPGVASKVQSGPAYTAYLQGRFFAGRATKDGLERAVAHYEEALRLDPAFAPAWAGLSRARAVMGTEGFAPPDTVVGEARRAAERAVALDPQLADGHLALSIVRRAYDWDWHGADVAIQRALALEPNNADIVFGAGRMASTLGRIEDALALSERAAALDPLNAQVLYRLGRNQQFLGQHDAAVRSLTRALELAPDYPAAHANLGLVLLAQSRVEAAFAELAREKVDDWLRYGEAIAWQLLGRRAEADAAVAAYIASAQDTGAFQIAQIYALRGEAGEALAWLERAYTQRDTGLSQLKSTAYFDRLEGDPSYQAFLDKMRLPR